MDAQSFASIDSQDLADLDAAINAKTSIKDEAADRTTFKKYGFYSTSKFIYNLMLDSKNRAV